MNPSKNFSHPSSSFDWTADALAYSIACIRENITNLESFPELTEGEDWFCVDNGGWVGGHWVGLIWLAYKHTQDPALEAAARTWADSLAPRQFDTTTH